MSSNPTPHAGPEQYVFITPVWGDLYVERFVKISLPAQLSAGNLGAMPADRSLYLIYTLREHVKAIRQSAAYKRLKTMVPVSIRSLDDLPSPMLHENPHELQTAAYMRGIAAGEGKQSAFVFMTPDILMGDGSFASMVKLTDQGKRVILVAGVRMTAEGAVACIARQDSSTRGVVTISPRTLVRGMLDSPHALTVGHTLTDDKLFACQHVYWKVADHGLLVRGFHIHPILVWPREEDAAIRNTLDDEYISRACPDRNDWYTVTDSDEMCVIEFSDRNHKLGGLTAKPMTDHEIVKFIHEGTTEHHRLHVLDRIRFHAKDMVAAEWEKIEETSDAYVEKYLRLYQMSAHERSSSSLTQPTASPNNNPDSRADSSQHSLEQREASSTRPSLQRRARTLLRRVIHKMTAPLRMVNRMVNARLFHHLDQLTHEMTDLRYLLHHTREVVQIQSEKLEAFIQQTAREERARAISTPAKSASSVGKKLRKAS